MIKHDHTRPEGDNRWTHREGQHRDKREGQHRDKREWLHRDKREGQNRERGRGSTERQREGQHRGRGRGRTERGGGGGQNRKPWTGCTKVCCSPQGCDLDRLHKGMGVNQKAILSSGAVSTGQRLGDNVIYPGHDHLWEACRYPNEIWLHHRCDLHTI